MSSKNRRWRRLSPGLGADSASGRKLRARVDCFDWMPCVCDPTHDQCVIEPDRTGGKDGRVVEERRAHQVDVEGLHLPLGCAQLKAVEANRIAGCRPSSTSVREEGRRHLQRVEDRARGQRAAHGARHLDTDSSVAAPVSDLLAHSGRGHREVGAVMSTRKQSPANPRGDARTRVPPRYEHSAAVRFVRAYDGETVRGVLRTQPDPTGQPMRPKLGESDEAHAGDGPACDKLRFERRWQKLSSDIRLDGEVDQQAAIDDTSERRHHNHLRSLPSRWLESTREPAVQDAGCRDSRTLFSDCALARVPAATHGALVPCLSATPVCRGPGLRSRTWVRDSGHRGWQRWCWWECWVVSGDCLQTGLGRPRTRRFRQRRRRRPRCRARPLRRSFLSNVRRTTPTNRCARRASTHPKELRPARRHHRSRWRAR